MSSDQQQQHLSTSSPPSSLVWFLLVDAATGESYKETTADKVSLPPSSVVDQFRDAVKAKYGQPAYLRDIPSGALLVYKNKTAFDNRNAEKGKKEPLKSSHPLVGLGKAEEEEDMLVVVVPSSKSSSRSTSKSTLTRGKEPNPKRKRRWIKLNDIIDRNAKKSASSDITWNQIRSVFNPTKFAHPRKEIDDAQLSFLAQYLSITIKCFRDITTGNDTKRLHFIAPILICVCILLNGDVEIVVEEDLVGTFVKAHGHFEFMLRRGNKAVCIVLAKKDDIEQGMIQSLVGGEVAAEVGGLDIVYGVVTNYIQWNFLSSLDDKVRMEECSLNLTPDGPGRKSLKEIAEKIYAIAMFSS